MQDAKRLNILFVVEEIYPDVTGGVHTYVYNIAKGLAVKGHNITVLTRLANPHLAKEEQIQGFKVIRYGFKDYSFSIARQISCVLNIRKLTEVLLKKDCFDLINLHSPQSSLGVYMSKASRRIPKIYTFSALQHEEDLLTAKALHFKWYQWKRYIKPIWLLIYSEIMKSLERRALKDSQKIITLSDYTAKTLAEVHGIPAGKIEKIPGGVDVNLFRPTNNKEDVRKRLFIPQEKHILFTLRRLVARMGLDNLIKAIPIVIKRHPEALLLIGGEGPMKSELAQLIEKLNLKNCVKLLGYVSQDMLPLYYQAADLFILPSRALEGFGIVTPEALSCGTPVLGTPVGGTIEILSRLDNELLFKDISAGSMAELILKFLDDPGKLAAAQAKCRKFALDNYSWDNSVDRTEKLFFQIKRTKVLLITGAYPPLKDGIGDYTARLADNLKNNSNLEIEVVSSGQIKSWNIFGVLDIIRHIKEKDINIVHIQYPSSRFRRTIALAFLPLFVKLINRRAKVVITLHEFSISYPVNKLRQLIMTLFSDRIMVSDDKDSRQLAGSCVGILIKNKLVIIPIGSNIDVCPADLQRKEKFLKEHGLDSKTLIISFFGFIHKNKGVEILLDALAVLKNNKIPVFLVFIGELKPDDPYHRRIQHLIVSLGFEDSLYLTGYCTANEASGFLFMSDLCVLPFLDGATFRRTTLITALSHGLAVITTKAGGYVPEGFIDGSNIVLVPVNDSKALAEAITSLGQDNALRKKIGTAAREFSERFSWDNIAARHVELYKNLLA